MISVTSPPLLLIEILSGAALKRLAAAFGINTPHLLVYYCNKVKEVFVDSFDNFNYKIYNCTRIITHFSSTHPFVVEHKHIYRYLETYFYDFQYKNQNIFTGFF